MRTLNKDQQGFAHTVLILLVVVLAGVGLVGYRVVAKSRKTTVAPTSVATKASTKITSKSDVKQTSKALDTDPGTAQLDTAQLDADLATIL